MSAAYDYDDEREQIDAFLRGRMEDPAAFLGLRMNEMGDGLRARVYAPGAQAVEVVDAADHERAWPLRNVHEEGVFAGPITGRRRRFDYRLRITRDGATADTLDPYGAPDLVSQDDILRFRQGRLWRAYEVLGAHPRRIGDVEGYAFTVWAPRARRVSVVGDFNDWDGRRHPMRRRAEAGLWELFLPELDTGAFYKFEIVDADGTVGEMKSDPAAFHAELRPDTASRLAGPISGDWSDPWTDGRAERNAVDAPISIYELHPGSWRRVPEEGDRPLTYAELGDYLIPYVTEMGFTHVQFLPITEHPFDGSWGYQPTGLFAPTSRFGTPEELRALVARLHEAGVGVLLDFVPAHFPTDAHGLGRFDGAPLYEHEDPQRGFHPDWGTYIYDYGKPEVRNFLISAALYWLDAFHLDGLRIDAVSSMLYLDYSRKEGEWSPNIYGGNINLEAADFVRLMNEMAYGENDGVMMVAEESTAWPGVCRPTHDGGLGFGFKWNLGWMHDTLQYMSRDPIHRSWHHNEITFGLVYAWSENFVLALSHDEVVHGKGSLLRRMPGDTWKKFANLRAYFALMWAHPGKKLLFMGGEFAQWNEWSHDASLDWHLLNEPGHEGVRRLVRDLNHAYRDEPALHELDCAPEGFEWLQADASDISVFAFLRWDKARARPILAALSFTPVPREGLRVGVPVGGRWRVIINTDAPDYDGSGMAVAGALTAEATPCDGQPFSLSLTLPPLGGLILVHED